MDFNNKVVLITGASTGIGRELAVQLSKMNTKLALVARRENLLQDLTNDNIIAIKCDVSKKEEVEFACQKIINKFGKIDIAILNAGIGRNMKVTKYNSALAEDIFGANVFGMIYWIEQLLPDFLKRKSGMIVGVSSLADSRGFSGSGFYCASKAAASIYLEGLRVELKRHNVKVITVKPGFVRTPMTDQNKFKMPFLMETEKAAEIILRGINKEKRIIQFPMPIVIMSKIISILPELIFEKFDKR